jgi:4-amino-4-deoxy-L-arabinose transferase-like glycosyltransferase
MKNKLIFGIAILLLFIAIFSISYLHPKFTEGDTVSYQQSMKVLETGAISPNFVPNRVLTTFLGMETIIFANKIIGNLAISWLLVDTLLYAMAGLFFFLLLQKIFEDKRIALVGMLLLVTNYAMVVFGLNYLLDIGGWAFYCASIFFSFNYLKTRDSKWLWWASAMVGLGSLFKEYGILGFIVIFGLILFTEWKNWKQIFKKVLISGLISFTPLILVSIYIFLSFHYTYLSWFSYANTYVKNVYSYKSRIVEYIKSFGSLYNFGWFLFLGGAYYFIRESKKLFQKENVYFIWLVLISSLPVFIWPGITQRISFITIPAVIIISCMFLKNMNKKWWYAIIPLVIFYIVSSYIMDSFILGFVNLPF